MTIRHPEKINNKSNPIPKKPPWIRVKAPTSKFSRTVKSAKTFLVCGTNDIPTLTLS